MFPGQDAALIERMFDLFDTDGSGIIELRKFIIGLSNVSSISTVEKVKLAFSLYDLGNSGSLEYAEVLQLLIAAQAGIGPISDSDVRTRVGYACAYDKSSSFGDDFRAFR
ncbi:protein phosphatase 2B regulatory subunit, putative [Perkinsus marinus ATCC 50983]|uniref:Protein phosphatase 2B regulatory subunit, putative n=1 Tax=Perkinsus marinus (strain ATCC 50983 / TXsc) TaxID=423536 RepID=C5LPQ5_PERM5|nr:protein phosphatase 2B regulatory subunit, putative [Perkinsus marinus ATCC 50983]EER01288.1 protein phosphatase 2B regulatory subunit, putative [Perkinsus marinus ATCC 50983]|eukprot:XP_002768570.1 protein phosphatase 2B regulatory subunit, putative [Perkinsus marinus ATCC 50983]